MYAIVKRYPEPKAEITTLEIPKAGESQVLVKVKATSICGTDIHIWDWNQWAQNRVRKLPIIFGHEVAGEVVEVGLDVVDIQPGARVAIDPSIYCNRCNFCRENKQNFCVNYRGYGIHYNGGFEEFVAVHQRNLYLIEGLSYLEGAMVEPVGCGIHGMKQIDLQLGEHVLIFGCGPIGLIPGKRR